ncbi:hypothetical protein, partial [Marinobacter nauticus]|uniref:hypothetical protein n=1 Tax=Marinobacter nauticus TaxID=2743 RepID=UPI00373522FE
HEENRSNWSRIFPTLGGPNTGSGSGAGFFQLWVDLIRGQGHRLGIDNHGWLDYWVQKDNKWTFLIEAKHGKHCFNRPLTDRNNRIIQSSIRQLRGIEGPNLEELSFDGKGFKIALTILPIYRTMSRVTDDDLYVTNPTKTDELESTLDLLVDGLAAKSSWVGVWSLPRRMQFSIPASWSESRMLTYPAVALVATVVT